MSTVEFKVTAHFSDERNNHFAAECLDSARDDLLDLGLNSTAFPADQTLLLGLVKQVRELKELVEYQDKRIIELERSIRGYTPGCGFL